MNSLTPVVFDLKQPAEFFTEALGYTFMDFGRDPFSEKNKDVIAHVSSAMAGFLRTDRFVPTEMRRRFDTISDMYMKALSREERIMLGQNVGDFALFMSGMFPEALDNIGYYEEVGSTGYSNFYVMTRAYSPNPVFYTLARNFPLYRRRVHYARNKYMHFIEENDGSIRVVPTATPRFRGLQQQDGIIKRVH